MTYQASRRNIRLCLTGDSMITRPMSIFDEPDFLRVVDLLRGADASVTNVEMLFHDYEGSPAVVPGGSYMRAAPHLIDELRWIGINAFAAANNHNGDWGEVGLLTHIGHLERSGVTFAGIGRTLGEAREPRYLDTRNGRVALLSLTTTGPRSIYAGHQWRDGRGRPGANMLRYTMKYTVDDEVFAALQRMNAEFGLAKRLRRGPSGSNRNQSLGISDIPDTADEFYLGDLQSGFLYPAPDGYRIARGDAFAVEMVPDQRDLDEILQRVADARRMADWVVLSVHNHEGGRSADEPSSMIVRLAHAAIDAGADIFHGHGPHRDRGIEIYRGKPIFYSLGHFIVQHDTITRVPWDNMVRQGHGWEATPADFYDIRSGVEAKGEFLGHAGNPAAWRGVVAAVDFAGGELSRIELHPIELGFRLPRSQRGRPVMARPAEAAEVLALFERLSRPFGTVLTTEGSVGIVALPTREGVHPGQQTPGGNPS